MEMKQRTLPDSILIQIQTGKTQRQRLDTTTILQGTLIFIQVYTTPRRGRLTA